MSANLIPIQKKIINAILQVFETGKYNINSYGAVANIKGDAGSVSLGAHQASLTSGNLYLLLKKYVDSKGLFAKDLGPFMDKVRNKDRSLEKAPAFISLLKKAGSDPIMQITQDDFFDKQFLDPAIAAGQALGFTEALSFAVIYDSFVHGSWKLIRDRTNKIARINDEKVWIKTYLDQRKSWLANHSNAVLHGTVYRANTFLDLIKAKNWSLDLPITCHGIKLTAALLALPKAAEIPATVSDIPADIMVKAPETPVLIAKPDDKTPVDVDDTIEVEDVQKVLQAKGFYKYRIDNKFGPIMEKAVKAFQKANNLDDDGVVGNKTLAKLGLL